MKKQIEFCLPTAGKAMPSGDDWIHEVKYDGYCMRVVRSGKSVRLYSKGGTDWTKRYPWIVETTLKIKHDHFTIDGEAVILSVDGTSDFNALHSRQDDHGVQLYAFDCLSYGEDDLRRLPLSMRKTNLMELRGRSQGILVAPYEAGNSNQSSSRPHAGWGSRGWSRSMERAYRVGRCDHWIKVKNRTHPADTRVMESF